MLGRRKPPVLASVPAPVGETPRLGALGRAELEACSQLAVALAGSRAVMATGPARSAVALGLATAATADGRRVVLLECDLASPGLAGLLGLSATPGLHEYLRGEADAAQILQSLVLAGPASGRATQPLACIVAGEPEPDPAALLDSDRCVHATGKLRRAYDLLVIDGPPAGPGTGPLRALSDQVDATVVCGERGAIAKRLPIPVAGRVLFGEDF
jgi:Mrp family chromosome partitioning ATPase